MTIFSSLRWSLLHQAYLTDLFGVDQAGTIQTYYRLISYDYLQQWMLTKQGSITSLSSLYPHTNWLERELWEMFGITVQHHPDLRRLLTDYGFKGYPLQKKFPLLGYQQVNYSEKKKRIISQPVLVTQEFREFNFTSPWLA